MNKTQGALTAPNSIRASFTIFASTQPLTKRFDIGPDGRIVKSKGVSFGLGRASRVTLDGAIPAEVLTAFGSHLDKLSAYHAIGLGTERSGLSVVDVVTQAMVSAGNTARTLEFWHYPPGPGLFGVDLDSGRDFNRLAESVYPPWAEVATLTRGSVSDGISNPETGETLEGSGEHVYAIADDLPRSKAAAQALHRLFWQAGLGHVMVGIDGKLYQRSPIDLAVFSPERVLYEGAARLQPPLVAAPRACTVRDGGVLIVNDIIAYSEARISAAAVSEMFARACQDPDIQAASAAKNAAYNADRIARGEPPILIRRKSAQSRSLPAPRGREPRGRAVPDPRFGVVRDDAWRAARWRELQTGRA